jgi:hypothetical protein
LPNALVKDRNRVMNNNASAFEQSIRWDLQRIFLDFIPKLVAWVVMSTIMGGVVMSLLTSLVVFPNIEWPWSTSVYGPWPVQKEATRYYSFNHVRRSFGGIDLSRLEEFEVHELHSLIVKGTTPFLRNGLKKYMAQAFNVAEKGQVDPFWVLAVMWTESNFNPKALSSSNAIGLMQLLPGTAHHLSYLRKRPVSPKIAYHLAWDPGTNIIYGVHFLKRLLGKFEGSYKYATVSYNMGPARIRRRLRLGLPVGVRNLYLDKVTRAYRKLSKYVRINLVKRPIAYKKTLVVRKRWMAQGKTSQRYVFDYRQQKPFVTFL